MLLPDGVGVVFASMLSGNRLPCRITGIDTAEYILELAANRRLSVFLLGGRVGIADNAKKKLEEKIPSANDWEKIELEERIGGLTFAKNCLDEAWKRRKDVLA